MTNSAPPTPAIAVHVALWGSSRPNRLNALADLLEWLEHNTVPRSGVNPRYRLVGLNILLGKTCPIQTAPNVIIAGSRSEGTRPVWVWNVAQAPRDPARPRHTAGAAR